MIVAKKLSLFSIAHLVTLVSSSLCPSCVVIGPGKATRTQVNFPGFPVFQHMLKRVVVIANTWSLFQHFLKICRRGRAEYHSSEKRTRFFNTI